MHPKGDKYTGEYKDKNFNGLGTYNHNNGDKYFGKFSDSKFKGHGTMTYADGTYESGIWGEEL